MPLKHIKDIDPTLDLLKAKALRALGVADEVIDTISLVDAPDAAMGDRGFPVFALAKSLRKAPPLIAKDVVAALGEHIQEMPLIQDVIAAGPYANFKFHPGNLTQLVCEDALQSGDEFCANLTSAPQRYMIEYSAPNTNKPQHLGHVRNDLLGATVTRLLRHVGHQVIPVNLINDRGIHICKSMLAYKEFGHGETPQSTGIKGDHLVGKYYVVFNTKFTEEYAAWQQSPHGQQAWEAARQIASIVKAREAGAPEEELHETFFKDYEHTYFNQLSPLGQRTRQMLLDWEQGDAHVRALWEQMNRWVVDGFDLTYKRLGVDFDHVYMESEMYLLGKDLVQQGLDAGIFHTLEGGAVACDLSQIGMKGEKILLRSDGTSVYMTQDLGTAISRVDEHEVDEMIYVVGDEQNYHFNVLFGILGLLRPKLKGKLRHLSYGMVNLADGSKMKSREGRAVDADDLMDSMHQQSTASTSQKHPDWPAERIHDVAEAIGMASLKYFILDVTPPSSMLFDPDASLDFKGRTGAYVQYTYARIQSLLRELDGAPDLTQDQAAKAYHALGTPQEMQVVKALQRMPHSMEVAARDLDPAKITEALFDLCQAVSTLYNHKDHRIKAIDSPRREGLLLLMLAAARAIKALFGLLGLAVLDEM